MPRRRRRDVIGHVLHAARAFFRTVRAARLLGRGLKLHRAGSLAEAREVLLDALDLTGRKGRGPLWFSTRLCALGSLSTVAAGLDDEELALKSIHEGLALWQEAGLERTDPRYETIVAWESWAHGYLERARGAAAAPGPA